MVNTQLQQTLCSQAGVHDVKMDEDPARFPDSAGLAPDLTPMRRSMHALQYEN